MKILVKLSILVLLVSFVSCTKDSDFVEEIDLRDSIVGRWNAVDNLPAKNSNERVVSFYKVEGSDDQVKVVNLVKSDLFFIVSLDKAGNSVLTLSEDNIMSIEIENQQMLVFDNSIELTYDFQGIAKESRLVKY